MYHLDADLILISVIINIIYTLSAENTANVEENHSARFALNLFLYEAPFECYTHGMTYSVFVANVK